VGANNKVIEAGEKHGVSTYIYIPCIVYGQGSGFGNRISIQTVAVVRAAKAQRKVYKVDNENGVSLMVATSGMQSDFGIVLARMPHPRYSHAVHPAST
jgi:Na+-transporting NADH:ubiquinone oxidoreductase subunit NqrE